MRLIIEDLDGATTVVNLGTEEVTIGRKPHNTIQLTEQNVSRSHAKLIFQDDGWLIHDLGSYNGVKVNGVPIAGPTIVRESDLIQIGDYHLTLTDDVDRETVDIERPRVAANDGMPMAMSSSTDLPSMSVEDLPPMRPPPAAVAGGMGASAHPAEAPRPDEEKKSKAGLIIGVVGALAAVVGIAVWLASGSGKDPAKDEGKSELASERESGAEQVEPEPEQTTAAPEPGESGAAADGGAAVPTDDGGELVETDDGGEVVPTDDGGELVETDGGDEPQSDGGGDEPEPQAKDPKKPKPKPRNRDKPSKPKLPPDQALAEARKASLKGNNKDAYSLAKDAYDQNKSSEALSVMGIAACKMGSASKAKSAYKKMSAKDKQTLEKICKPLGIELE